MQQEIKQLTELRDWLTEILDLTANKIKEGRHKGIEMKGFEADWNKMLNDYGLVCDRLQELSRKEVA